MASPLLVPGRTAFPELGQPWLSHEASAQHLCRFPRTSPTCSFSLPPRLLRAWSPEEERQHPWALIPASPSRAAAEFVGPRTGETCGPLPSNEEFQGGNRGAARIEHRASPDCTGSHTREPWLPLLGHSPPGATKVGLGCAWHTVANCPLLSPPLPSLPRDGMEGAD